MSTRDLIDAIESGNSSAIQQHFQDAIMSRVAERLDTMRIETAKNMFKSSVNEEVEQIDELSKDTLMSYVNKVSADSQKHPQDPTKRSREKANRSVAGFAKAYNKLTKNKEAELDENVDHEYLEQVLADNNINSKVMGNTVHVDHDDVEKAQELVKYHGYDHKVIGGLNEAKKLIGTYDNGNHTAKVYHLSGEHDEGDPYHVKLFKDGKHYEPADYFTNDKDDAHSTAKDMVRRGARNESVELDETSCGTKKKWGAIKDSMKDSVKK